MEFSLLGIELAKHIRNDYELPYKLRYVTISLACAITNHECM